jgi:enoyl-CoA hydratase/carnithine racemase
MSDAPPPLQTLSLAVEAALGIASVQLNRPKSANSMTLRMFEELEVRSAALHHAPAQPSLTAPPQAAFTWLESQPAVRAVVVSGAGDNFCAGLDLTTLTELVADARASCACEARQKLSLYKRIRALQHAVSALERFPYPVVCAVHGACVGGGLDLITAADVRFAACDSRLSVLEVELAITADLGVLQRLPLLVGEGRARELALSARTFSGLDGERYGLFCDTFHTPADTLQRARACAIRLAAKSPLALSNTKAVLVRRTQDAVALSLEHVAWMNAATLVSTDLREAVAARSERRAPVFAAKL